jgi:hypothetical protein
MAALEVPGGRSIEAPFAVAGGAYLWQIFYTLRYI